MHGSWHFPIHRSLGPGTSGKENRTARLRLWVWPEKGSHTLATWAPPCLGPSTGHRGPARIKLRVDFHCWWGLPKRWGVVLRLSWPRGAVGWTDPATPLCPSQPTGLGASHHTSPDFSVSICNMGPTWEL